jgi:uncharacterized membrane protein YfcA
MPVFNASSDDGMDLLSLDFLLIASAVALVAGVVKGVVGFGMPMILMSGISTFFSPELALAALILPTLLSNGLQTFRRGASQAVRVVWNFRLYIAVMLVLMVIAAQLTPRISEAAFLLIVGIPIVLLSVVQILGWRPVIDPARRIVVEIPVAIIAGISGGLSGIWGPPTTLFLTAIQTPKSDQLQIQGVIYGMGSVILFLAHLRSGILNPETLTLSAIVCVPAFIGLVIGFRLHDKMDQNRFRTATLFVLVIAGLNLIRRGLMG